MPTLLFMRDVYTIDWLELDFSAQVDREDLYFQVHTFRAQAFVFDQTDHFE
jgi:hypothetical protein